MIKKVDILKVMSVMVAVFCMALSARAETVATVERAEVAANVDSQPEIARATLRIETITKDLIALIESAQSYVEDDEPRFYRELGDTLEKYVDFEKFSRAVMGRYAGMKAMSALDEQGRQKLEGQIARFNAVFKQALINTYGKGLLVFDGERIEVVPPAPEAAAKAKAGKAMVKQLIFGDREKPFEIYYSMRVGDDGEWKIRNMIVEASNLGKIYRNQFSNAYKVYEGDIDKVIDNWAGAES